MRLLADEGRNDLAWKLAMSDKLRTWRYWIVNHGATNALEAWDTAESKHGTWNHPALVGGIAAWLYRELAGIKPLTPGYETVLIKPFVPEGVESASGSVHSPFGLVESAWTCKDGVLKLKLNIPVGAKANVILPGERTVRNLGSGHHVLSLDGGKAHV
jgi:alpha-L-rhamnosidase